MKSTAWSMNSGLTVPVLPMEAASAFITFIMRSISLCSIIKGATAIIGKSSLKQVFNCN